MPRPSPSWFLVVLPAFACAEASVPAIATGAPLSASIEVRLAEEDKAWLAELVSEGRVPARVEPLTRTEPARRPASGLRAPEDVQEQTRIVHDGPVASASYNSGSALYEGQQIQRGEDWVRHGAWKAWHADGKPWEEGAYRDGEEDGPWRWWYENGNPQALGTFADGRHVGGWIYYHENGHVLAEGVYEDDRPVGTWRTYHENGGLHSEGRFEGGQREGRWVVFDPEGVRDAAVSGLYREGERVGD